MIEGQKCHVRKAGDGWEVKIGPGSWHAFFSKSDAELVSSAGQLLGPIRAPTSFVKDVVQAIERAGIAQHPDVLVVYDKLMQELRKRERK